MKQATLDRIRRMNKRVTNKLLIRIAGKKSGCFAILTHTGPKTGTPYRTPIIAEPVPEGEVIALTYGKEVDWYKNVIARGECSLAWKDQAYLLTEPVLIDREDGLKAFPAIFRNGLKFMKIEYFLRMTTGGIV